MYIGPAERESLASHAPSKSRPPPLIPIEAQFKYVNSILQAAVSTVTFAVIAGLFLQPNTKLSILWIVMIPVLPASFLIAPSLWRSVCLRATLSMLPNGLISQPMRSQRTPATLTSVGILLLVILVPERRFLFNEHGEIRTITILIVAASAAILGALFSLRSAFCYSFCPV